VKSPFNTLTGEGPWGIAASGIAFNYVADAIKDLGIEDKVRVLKLGFTYPFPDVLAEEFIRSAEKILVVEELEPFLEENLKVTAYTNSLSTPISGKGSGLFSRLYEYNPGMVREVIARFFGVDYTRPESIDIKEDGQQVQLPVRPPNLCAGCPHRATYLAVKPLSKRLRQKQSSRQTSVVTRWESSRLLSAPIFSYVWAQVLPPPPAYQRQPAKK